MRSSISLISNPLRGTKTMVYYIAKIADDGTVEWETMSGNAPQGSIRDGLTCQFPVLSLTEVAELAKKNKFDWLIPPAQPRGHWTLDLDKLRKAYPETLA